MKRVLLFGVLSLGFGVNAMAQYCGHFGNPSNPSQCDHHTVIAPPGFSPISDSISPYENGVFSSTVLQVRFDTLTFGGQAYHILWCRIDSIGNLPSGLCWATDTANNTFDSTGGCIKISGTPCDAPGQYAIKVIFTVNVGIEIQTTSDAAGVKEFLRLKNSGDADFPVDTTQSPSTPVLYYGNAISGCIPNASSIHETVSDAIFHLFPNPATNTVTISIDEEVIGSTATLTDITGRKMTAVQLQTPNTKLETQNFANGVYFVTITAGNGMNATKKLIIQK